MFNKTTMEVVRDVLDKKLKGNDINLVDNILSYIDTDPENYVRFCSECNCLDKINYQNEKCDICSQKEFLITELDREYSNYYYLIGRNKGYDSKTFSSKLNTYLENVFIQHHKEED